ncbi:MAG: YkgJ family cysteine cluster protein [Aquificae bacterium]|nr:YkgJ family cysteine cluster protein [Aquificota bacterium]
MEGLEQLIIASAHLLRQPQLVEELIEYQKEIHRKVDREVSAEEGLACGKGCTHCCYGWLVKMTVPEALYMLRELNSLPERKREKLAEKLERYALVEDYTNVPCPMLEGELCAVYPARPYICRTYTSYDRKACENGEKIRFPEFVEEITKKVKVPMEETVEPPFDVLFKTRLPITAINYDWQKGRFFLNLASTVRIIPMREGVVVEPLEYAKKYLQM